MTIVAAFALGAAATYGGLWDGATPVADGWLRVDWYGFLQTHGDWIYHSEQGWQFCSGEQATNVFVYDWDLRLWGWTGAQAFPWVYWYEPVNAWAYLLRPAQAGQRWYYHTAALEWRHQSALKDGVFRAGAVAVAEVPARAEETEVTEPQSGQRFAIPAGGPGRLRVARLTTAPQGPFPGEGFLVEVDGLRGVRWILDGEEDGSGDFPMVFAYGKMQGAFDDAIGYDARWVALPYEALPGGKIAFALPFPDPASADAGASSPMDFQAAELPRAQASPPPYYWVSKISADTPAAEQRTLVRWQIQEYADQFLGLLGGSQRASATARRQERLPSLQFGGNYYTGFNKLRIGSWGRSFQPVIAVTSPKDTFSLAHETAHYLTHLLVGHDAYDALESAGGSLFAGAHGIRDLIGRTNLLEDYAYFIESLLIQTGGNYDLQKPHVTFGGLSPLTKDFPGLEGFAATMLAMLLYDGDTVSDHFGNSHPVQPLALAPSKVLEIVSRGATSVDALRQQISQSLGSAQREAFAVLLQRLGWSYFVRGRLVDAKGAPLANADIVNIKRLGDDDAAKEFIGGWTNRPSQSDGSFSLVGDVFGGTSLLRLTLESGAVVEVPITVDWNNPTDRVVNLADIVVDTGTVYRSFTVDYQGLGSGWPKNFTVTMGGDLKFILEGADAGAMRIERDDYYGGNTVYARLRVYIPASASLRIEGSLYVIPSAMSGTDVNDYPGATPFQWELRDLTRYVVPQESIVSQEAGVVVFDHTPPVRYGSSWRVGITVSESGNFWATDKDRSWRMSSYTARAEVNIIAE